jgi:hypothetical protein
VSHTKPKIVLQVQQGVLNSDYIFAFEPKQCPFDIAQRPVSALSKCLRRRHQQNQAFGGDLRGKPQL